MRSEKSPIQTQNMDLHLEQGWTSWGATMGSQSRQRGWRRNRWMERFGEPPHRRKICHGVAKSQHNMCLLKPHLISLFKKLTLHTLKILCTNKLITVLFYDSLTSSSVLQVQRVGLKSLTSQWWALGHSWPMPNFEITARNNLNQKSS